MRYAKWQVYISIGIAIVALCGALKAQDASPTPAPTPTQALPDIPAPAGDVVPSLDINVPPPPDSPHGRRRLGPNRSRPEEGSPSPRVFPRPGDASPLSGQWSITNPHGTMTHTWQTERSEDGYSLHREHTWTAPDGTPLRSQEFDTTVTGPNNYQRQRTITLRDGRTIQHSFTRSWDGETFQSEHTFSGPNGQTWTHQHTWTPGADEAPAPPGEPVPPVPTAPPAQGPGGVVQGPPGEGQPPSSPPGRRLGQLNRQGGSDVAAPPASRPSGFTLGASGWRGWSTAGQSPASRLSRPPETAPSLGKRFRTESPNSDRPGLLRPSTLPRPRGKR